MSDLLTGIAQMFGVSNDAMLIFIGFLIPFFLALFVMIEMRQHRHEDHASDAAVAIFMMILFIECLMGIMNWFIFIVLLILFGAYEYTMVKK